MSAGSLIQPSSKKESICFSPEPSMSKARRETKCFRCSVFWNGQANSPEQRKRTPSSPAELISRTTGVCSGHGQVFGNAYGFAPFGRFSSTTPSTCGITSPARWIVTVSPMRTSSRAISSALCRVAFCTTTPPTVDRLELRDRRERAGAPDLDLDVAHHAWSPARPGICARSPSAAMRETKPSRSCQSSRSTL